MQYYGGDVVKTTRFLDLYSEWTNLLTYWNWAVEMQDRATELGDRKQIGFYEDLRDNLNMECNTVGEEFLALGNMALLKNKGGTYRVQLYPPRSPLGAKEAVAMDYIARSAYRPDTTGRIVPNHPSPWKVFTTGYQKIEKDRKRNQIPQWSLKTPQLPDRWIIPTTSLPRRLPSSSLSSILYWAH